MNRSPCVAVLLAATLLTAQPIWAGPGHDHGDSPAAPVGQALPRFSAVSETFELVGVVSDKQITLYLDRFTDNSPVRGAQIELEIGGVKFMAQSVGEDLYQVTLAEAPKAGVLPVTATITAGNEVDLLAGELDIHEAPHTHGDETARAWTAYAAWGGGGAAALAVLAAVVLGRRRIGGARSVRVGGAA